MTKAELFELLHFARKRLGAVRARVRVQSQGYDPWGRASDTKPADRTFEVTLRTGDDADAVFRSHVESSAGHWQQCAFDPNVVIPELWLEPLDEVTIAGRKGIRVRAKQRRTTHDYLVLPMSTEDYELVVDAERGILLRLACLVEGDEVLVYEIEEITLDP